MSRDAPYTGPSDSSDLAGLDANSMAAARHSYRLFGDCFEKVSEGELPELGVYLDAPLALIRERLEDRSRSERELASAVQLSRHKGISWHAIGAALRVSAADARLRFKDQ